MKQFYLYFVRYSRNKFKKILFEIKKIIVWTNESFELVYFYFRNNDKYNFILDRLNRSFEKSVQSYSIVLNDLTDNLHV